MRDDAGEANGFTMEVITLEVGTRGFLNLKGFKDLLQTLTRCPRKKHVELFKDHLQNNYTPITENLDYEEHYNLVNILPLCI